MEFTPALSAFQGVVISADSVCSFSKLRSKGVNEDRIDYVVDFLRIFLQKERYMVEDRITGDNVPIMRKFAFYICINSDLPILEELVDLDGIDFVIFTIPTISQCLMSEIFWQLNMEIFLYEILVFTCPLLSLEVAEAVLENFKYFEPTECLPKLKLLSLGCYRLLCRLIFFNLESNEIKRSCNNFQRCLNYFSEPPNNYMLERLNTDDEYRFIANRLYEMLLLVSECFTHYTSEQKFKPSDFQEIYELSYREGLVINEKSSVPMSECTNNDVLQALNNCNIALLDKCKSLVMEVSVEIFCAWSEFEENGKNMQQTIGELCYNIHSNLSKISSVTDHVVFGMLQQISCKPMDLAEAINKSDSTIIIENINKKDNESTQWIKALIYKENLCEDISLIEQIATHLEVLNETESYKLFKIIYNFLTKNDKIESKDTLLLLAIKAFHLCTSINKHEIVEEHYCNASFSDILQTTEFDDMMTEIFNKLTLSPEADLSDVLTVFLQSPKKVYSKIFALASENMHQTDIMLKVMKCLEKFSKHYYYEETEPCIILITKEIISSSLDSEAKQENFINFLKSLKSTKAISGAKLLLLIIMPNLHSGLLNKNITQICIHCQLLQAAYNLDELIEYRAPILAMLAQVLDIVRWKMNTYVVQAPSTLLLVLQLQSVLYTHDMTEKETTWLKSKLRNINPLNMYYFRRLWNPPGNTFVEIVSGMHIHKDMDIEHLSLWLSQTLSSTILQEWYQIWDSLCTVFGNVKMLDIFHDALLLLFVAEKSNHTKTTKACLLYCMKNFVATMRFKFLTTPLNDSQVLNVFDKLAIIENVARESDLEELTVVVLPLFAYMAEKKGDLSADLPQILVRKFKNKKLVVL